MSRRIFTVVFLLVMTLPGPTMAARHTGGNTGIGFVLGDPDGLSLKFWGKGEQAVQIRLGSPGAFNAFTFTATLAHHFEPFAVKDDSYSIPFYIGGGFRGSAMASSFTYLDGGLVGVIGTSVFVKELPVEFFLEVRPVVALYDDAVGVSGSLHLGIQTEGALGIHYYF